VLRISRPEYRAQNIAPRISRQRAAAPANRDAAADADGQRQWQETLSGSTDSGG
jgi:hypothetical protein